MHTFPRILSVIAEFLVTLGQLTSDIRQATYSKIGSCSTDEPYAVNNVNKRRCSLECLQLATCEDLNHVDDADQCALFLHKPLFYDVIPGCAGFKVSRFVNSYSVHTVTVPIIVFPDILIAVIFIYRIIRFLLRNAMHSAVYAVTR